MRHFVQATRATLLVLVIAFAFLATAYAQGPEQVGSASPEGQGVLVPDATFCYQPDPAVDACVINYGEVVYHDIAGETLLFMTVTVDSEVRALYNFYVVQQDDIYLPYGTHPEGLRVACGTAGIDGNLATGYVYDVGMTAHVINGASSIQNYQVSCPAYTPQVPTAVGANSFTATLDRLAPYQGYLVALVVGVGLLVNLLVPARLKQWRKRTE